MVDIAESLEGRIRGATARVGMIRLGYVGLPLAVEFASSGLHVTGFDVQAEKVDAVNRGRSYVGDVPSERLAPLVSAGRIRATADFAQLAECDAVIICVPTPLSKSRDPDMSYVETPRSRPCARRCAAAS